MAFYQILQEIMDEKGMRVADVARACNLPDSTVRSILARKNESVALEVAFKLSKGLDVSLERLNNEYPEDHTSESDRLDVSDQGNTETIIKEMALKKYGSLKEFATVIDIPYTTLDSIFKRGIMNASVYNIFRICSGLNISADGLSKGQIIEKLPEAESSRDNTQFIITDTQECGLVTTYRALSPSGKEKLLSSAKDISILDQYKQEMQHYGSIAADTGGPGRLVRIPDETFNKNKKK